MVVAAGNLDMTKIVDSMILVAKDQTRDHELNKEKGRGSWDHPDGWGAAYIKEGKWVFKKSLEPFYDDPRAHELKKLDTNFIILHVRKKTKGVTARENTHPFHQDEFVFCHNGTVEDEIEFSPKYELKGGTDSEALFYSILSDLEHNDNFHFTTKKIQNFEKSSGSNIVLSSTNQTIIGVNFTTYAGYYKMRIARDNDFVLISSERLPEFDYLTWEDIYNGEILVLDHNTLQVSREKVITQPESLSLPESV